MTLIEVGIHLITCISGNDNKDKEELRVSRLRLDSSNSHKATKIPHTN